MSEAYLVARLVPIVSGTYEIASISIYSDAAWNLTVSNDGSVYAQLLPLVRAPSYADARERMEALAVETFPRLRHLFEWEGWL